MRILPLDAYRWFAFPPGHTAVSRSPEAYETPLEEILARQDAPPDCIIQMENLGARRFVTGLERANCPTPFLPLTPT